MDILQKSRASRAGKGKGGQSHAYYVTYEGYVVATAKNTCLEYHTSRCTRRYCKKYHEDMGSLMDVLPRCRSHAPTKMGVITADQANSAYMFVKSVSLLRWSPEDEAKVQALRQMAAGG